MDALLLLVCLRLLDGLMMGLILLGLCIWWGRWGLSSWRLLGSMCGAVFGEFLMRIIISF